MLKYRLKIRQCLMYPRCHINRESFQELIKDRGIHTNGYPGLFVYAVLCCYANRHPAALHQDGITYATQSGEFICLTKELTKALRLWTGFQTLEVLRSMQHCGLIQYELVGRDTVKVKIMDWHHFSKVQDKNCLNRNTSEFFLPSATAAELIGSVKCSEMDILLDIFVSAVYQDKRVRESHYESVVYFRNGTKNPLITYEQLSNRWGRSAASVQRILRKLEYTGYITTKKSVDGSSVTIYLAGKINSMFQVSDLMVDKDELPLLVDMPFVKEADDIQVIKSMMAEKVRRLLDLQGIGCARCRRSSYRIYPVSGDDRDVSLPDESGRCAFFRMDILCEENTPLYTFDLLVVPEQA